MTSTNHSNTTHQHLDGPYVAAHETTIRNRRIGNHRQPRNRPGPRRRIQYNADATSSSSHDHIDNRIIISETPFTEEWDGLPRAIVVPTSLPLTAFGRAVIVEVFYGVFFDGTIPRGERLIIHDPVRDQHERDEVIVTATVAKRERHGWEGTSWSSWTFVNNLPLDNAVIEALPTRKLTGFDVEGAKIDNEGDLECSICKEGRHEDDEVLALANCGHWLSTSHVCPVCRASVG